MSWVVFISMIVAGCSDAAQRDSGIIDVGAFDVDVSDAADLGGNEAVATPDAQPDRDAAGTCEITAGYRHCLDCEMPCPRPESYCDDRLGLCVSRDAGGCFYQLGNGQSVVCGDGLPCAISPEVRGDELAGRCVEPAFCLAGDAGLFAFECRYPDLTPVVTGPPAASCPTGNELAPFCAGACGRVTCPPTSFSISEGIETPLDAACVGLSDTRGFGVCAYAGLHCKTGFWAQCERFYGAPCACLVPQPQAPETELGFFVLRDACEAYRAVYPDGVACRDRESL